MKYEILFIVRPDLEESAIKGVFKKFETALADNGAKVLSSKELGQKELAYEINKHKTEKMHWKIVNERKKSHKFTKISINISEFHCMRLHFWDRIFLQERKRKVLWKKNLWMAFLLLQVRCSQT